MSIQSEITRLETAKNNIASAITDKGVTVPSGTKLDGMAALIADISSGIDTSDATATAGDILSGKTAYVDGEKITGVIATKTSSNLTASGATVTVPSGYYASQATKSVSTATQATPSISVSSAGLITASSTQSAGYVASGTKSATKQLTTQAAKTITPSTSSQTAVASGRYTTGTVTVAAIPSTYVKPTATKAAATYTPTTANQTISAGTYCSGAQTIKGDANLVAGNIKSGVSIFGVTGTYAGSGGGGGGVETCTGRVSFEDLIDFMNPEFPATYYTDANQNIASFNAMGNSTKITAIKGSLLYISSGATVDLVESATLICSSSSGLLFSIDGDEFRIYAMKM